MSHREGGNDNSLCVTRILTLAECKKCRKCDERCHPTIVKSTHFWWWNVDIVGVGKELLITWLHNVPRCLVNKSNIISTEQFWCHLWDLDIFKLVEKLPCEQYASFLVGVCARTEYCYTPLPPQWSDVCCEERALCSRRRALCYSDASTQQWWSVG